MNAIYALSAAILNLIKKLWVLNRISHEFEDEIKMSGQGQFSLGADENKILKKTIQA